MFTELKRLIKIMKIKVKRKKVIFSKKSNFSINSSFEGNNKLGVRTWFEGSMGFGSYIGDDCVISAEVGRYCSIGHKVTVLTGTHPSHVFVSTSPVFYSMGLQNGSTYVNRQKYNEKLFYDATRELGCEIGNDVWIGYNATIIGGCEIGDGAIVAAGALVRDNVEPYTIVAGQPAKVIGKRFSDEQIKWLCAFQWWEKPEHWIKEHVEQFEDVEQFIIKNSSVAEDL